MYFSKLKFETVDVPANVKDYMHLSDKSGLFREAMKYNYNFHCVSHVRDLTSSSGNTVGWASVFDFKFTTSNVSFPVFATYVQPLYRNKGLSTWLTLLTLDMAQEKKLPYLVIDDIIGYRTLILAKNYDIKIIPVWFDISRLIYPIIDFDPEELKQHGDINLLIQAGVPVWKRTTNTITIL